MARSRATVIVFWVPRELSQMPAFTTNVEFGEDYGSGRVVYGRPEGSPKTRYLDFLYRQRYGIDPCNTLLGTLERALSRLGVSA
jgi:hypothetical protein